MPIIIRTIINTLLTALIISFAGASASAESGIQPGGTASLGGFSPVSYFEQGKPERGKSRFQSTYQGNTYWFTSEKQKAMFDAKPEKFAPAFPNHCLYNLAMGRSEPIDPTNFKIVDGQLLLFHRSAENDGLRQWNQTVRSEAITERELIRRAKSNLLDIRF